MLCPRCDQQGCIHRVCIKTNREIVQLCDECDALWRDGIVPAVPGFIDFAEYVRPLGLLGLWSEVEVLPDENEA